MAISSIEQREDDGAIQLANNTGFAPGARGTVVAEAMIGDGPFGATTGDADWYRVDLAAGDVLTALTYTQNFGGALADLDTHITFITSLGTGTAGVNDDWDGLDSLATFTADTAGTYYIKVRDVGNFQSDQFDSGSGNGASISTGDYRLYINVNSIDVNFGTSGDDSFYASTTDSLINGRGGNDTIRGRGGDDVLDGGAGNDTLHGGGGNDTLIWTWDTVAQTDNMNVSNGGDSIWEMHGGAGGNMVFNFATLTMGDNSVTVNGTSEKFTVRMFGEIGDDVIDVRGAVENVDFGLELFGGIGNDTLFGYDGTINRGDLLDGGSGNDRLFAGAGDDTLYGGAGDDIESGGAGNDIFRADWDAGNDFFDGGAGSDRLAFNSSTSSISVNMQAGTASSSETGNDTFTGIENVVGGLENDVFTPGYGVNTINGIDGIDTLSFEGMSTQQNINLQTNTHLGTAAQGDTYLNIENVTAGSHDDALAGDGNDNTLSGNAGNDTLSGRLGNDTLIGGAGNDTLNGGFGDDFMIGGAGGDFYNGGTGGESLGDTISYAGSEVGVDVSLKDNLASSGDAVGDTFTLVENLFGSGGNDYFVGDTGANRLDGNLGNDTLYGWTGDDILNGDDGNDRIFGGAGLDTIRGGAGNDELRGNGDADIFVFADGFGTDTIFDFTDYIDKINFAELSGIVDFSDLQTNHLTFNGSGNAVVTEGSDVLTIVGLTNVNIDASDFVFTTFV